MNRVETLSEQSDLIAIAKDFSRLLIDPSNADIGLEFPNSVARYTGSPEDVFANLQDTIAQCGPGIRQQFVAYSGDIAVGMSAIRFADEMPTSITQKCPNVSSFICHPFRYQRLGTVSLQTRLRVVREQFEGKAWTQVKRTNAVSNALVVHNGFIPIDETDEHIIYTYLSK
jgi:hypothetical protein